MDTDPAFLVFDVDVPIVSKATGRVSYLSPHDPRVWAAEEGEPIGDVPDGWSPAPDVGCGSQPQAWEASGAGWAVEWSPTPPHLSGMGDVFEAVRFVLGAEEWVLVTPTGPCLRASEAEPLAVWALLCRYAERPFKESGDVPRMPLLPEGGAVG